MRPKTAVLALALLSLLAAGTFAGEIRPNHRFVAGDDPANPSPLRPRQVEMRGAGKATASDPTVCPDSLDMIHYELHINVKRASSTLEGVAILSFESLKAGLTGIRLDLRALTVSDVTRGGTPLAFTQTGDTLLVTLDAPVAHGDTATIEITYAGTPENEGSFGGFWFYPVPVTDFSMGVGLDTDPPSMGRYWFPAVDAPCDKATFEIFVETPAAKMAVSNGMLVSTTVDSVTGRKIWQWRENHQIATYLMAFSVAKYTAVADTVDPLITYYVHTPDTALALPTFSNVPYMMDGFESRFGAYPYDKFSYVTTPLGDMEHQTCVFHSNGLMTGDNTYDDILAHEMCHMWFGDMVTYGDWRDVWLSEGFATYGEALWHEYQYGTANYHWYVGSQLMAPYLTTAESTPYPIYDPDFKWGTVAYEKGGVVLHMLRYVMGDVPFFAALNGYLDAHRWDNAVTPDFQAACEAEHGSSLDWFFDEWIYSGGHPIFDWGWDAADLGGGSYEVTVRTRQVQTVGPIYTMPVEFRVDFAAGDTVVAGAIDSEENTLTFTVVGEPTNMVMDPDNWLLDQHHKVSTGLPVAAPARFSLQPNRPNPFNPLTLIPFSLPSAESVSLNIYSTEGRLVRALLDGAPMAAGDQAARWDGTDSDGRRVSSGVYFYRLRAGERSETRKMQLIR